MSAPLPFNGFSNYYPISDSYSIHRLLNSYRVVPDNPGNNPDYVSKATITDENGNEYLFQHSHSHSDLNGRPLPRMIDDCPRPNAEISSVTGECLDTCRTDFDCPISYGCRPSNKDGMNRCYPQICSNNADCGGHQCVHSNIPNVRVCKPELCGYAETTNENFEDPGRFPQEHCVSTSHSWLRGRTGLAPLDQRYDNLY